MLWKMWWELVTELRTACARERTFLWMALSIAGMTVRADLMGVTSFIRCLGLQPNCYCRLLDFFHSSAVNIEKLTLAWRRLVFKHLPGVIRVGGRPVLVGDGIKESRDTQNALVRVVRFVRGQKKEKHDKAEEWL